MAIDLTQFMVGLESVIDTPLNTGNNFTYGMLILIILFFILLSKVLGD